MSKLRILMLSVLATFCVSAVASQVAQAATPEWLSEKLALTKNLELKEKLTFGTYTLTGSLLGINVKIVCKMAVVLPKSFLVGSKLSIANVDFSECNVVEPAGCKVKEPIELVETEDELQTTTSDLFFPKGKKGAFVTITLEGCLVAGKFEVTGSQLCKLPGATTEAVEHSVECLAKESKLSFGGNAATFEGTFGVALANGAKFSTS